MLNDQQIKTIVTRVNERRNIPFLSEETEAKIFEKVVRKIDNFMEDNLPSEVYELIGNSVDGVDDTEAEMIITRVATEINNRVNLFWLSESTEQEIFERIIRAIVQGLRKDNVL